MPASNRISNPTFGRMRREAVAVVTPGQEVEYLADEDGDHIDRNEMNTVPLLILAPRWIFITQHARHALQRTPLVKHNPHAPRPRARAPHSHRHTADTTRHT